MHDTCHRANVQQVSSPCWSCGPTGAPHRLSTFLIFRTTQFNARKHHPHFTEGLTAAGRLTTGPRSDTLGSGPAAFRGRQSLSSEPELHGSVWYNDPYLILLAIPSRPMQSVSHECFFLLKYGYKYGFEFKMRFSVPPQSSSCGALSWAVPTSPAAQTFDLHSELPRPFLLLLPCRERPARLQLQNVSFCRQLSSWSAGHLSTFAPSPSLCSVFRKDSFPRLLTSRLICICKRWPLLQSSHPRCPGVWLRGPRKDREIAASGRKGRRGMTWHSVHFGGIYSEAALGQCWE